MASRESDPGTLRAGHTPPGVPFEFSPQGIGSVFGQIIRDDLEQAKNLGQFFATDVPVGVADLAALAGALPSFPAQITSALGGGVGGPRDDASFGEKFASSFSRGQETLDQAIPGLQTARGLHREAGERAFGGDPLRAIIGGLIAPGPGEIGTVRKLRAVHGISEAEAARFSDIPSRIERAGSPGPGEFTELDLDTFSEFLAAQGADPVQVAISRAAMKEGGFESTAEALERLASGQTRLGKRESDLILGISEPDNEAIGRFIGRLGGINVNSRAVADVLDDSFGEFISESTTHGDETFLGFVAWQARKQNFADMLGPVKLPEETAIYMRTGIEEPRMLALHEAGHALVGIRDKTMSGKQFEDLLKKQFGETGGRERFMQLVSNELIPNSQQLARPLAWGRAQRTGNFAWIEYASDPAEALADGIATAIHYPDSAKRLMPNFSEILQVMSQTDPVIKSIAQFRGFFPIALAGQALRTGIGFSDEGEL